MRNPDRIDLVLAKVKELWTIFPDWRLGQLIENVGCNFFTEDDKLIELIEALKVSLTSGKD